MTTWYHRLGYIGHPLVDSHETRATALRSIIMPRDALSQTSSKSMRNLRLERLIGRRPISASRVDSTRRQERNNALPNGRALLVERVSALKAMAQSVFAASFVSLSRILLSRLRRMIAATFVMASGLLVIAPQCISKSFAGPVYPLKTSKDGRYLVDQNNAPFLIMGDAPHAMIGNLTEAAAEQYLSDRASLGFNSIWVEVLCNSYCGCNANGSTRDGIPPLFKAGDLSTPNPDYFRKVDDVIKLAAQRGMVVFLDSFDTGGWLSALRSNGRSKDYDFGVYLGTRYKNFPNIIWITGNDFQTWGSNPSDNSDVEAIMHGIAASDRTHLQTTELNFGESGSLDDHLLSPYTSLAAAYSYYPTYREVYDQY